MALEILDVMRKLSSELREDMAVRIGIRTGPAVAGVIGTRKLFYDVWGDTVNTASRMESHGSAGKIQVTEDTKRALGEAFQFKTLAQSGISHTMTGNHNSSLIVVQLSKLSW